MKAQSERGYDLARNVYPWSKEPPEDSRALRLLIDRLFVPFTGLIIAALAMALSTGCSSLLESTAGGFANDLSDAILNQDDPETVRDGAPAYLLLVDTLVEGNPDRLETLIVAAKLYTAYGSVFVGDEARAKRLTTRAYRYGRRALCVQRNATCDWDELDFDEYRTALESLGKADFPALYAYTVSWLAYTRAHSDDWLVLAELPKVEWALERLYRLDDASEDGRIDVYLGVLNTLRPPALGGQPDLARAHFERAIQLSEGKDLNAKVEYARGYARLVYDRGLHDRLLNEVIEADPVAPGYTLFNTLAQREAVGLLESADEYF